MRRRAVLKYKEDREIYFATNNPKMRGISNLKKGIIRSLSIFKK